MSVWRRPGLVADSVRGHWLPRYGLAIVLFGATIGLSLLLTSFGIRINLTIPVVLALVGTAWFGGRGPGLVIAVLFQATTIIYTQVPADSTLPKAIFTYFSVFSLYVFLVFLISRLRRIQHSLAEQRDLLQVTLASIGDGVMTTDTTGRITFMNAIAEGLTGWSETDARNRPLAEVVRIINEETREDVTNPVEKVFETGAVVALANHSILVSKDGREIPIDNSAAPIRDGGEIRGVVLVFSDVSERKAAERSRRESEIMHRIVEAQEGERHRIARDLHDHLGQKMTALRLRIETLAGKCPDEPEVKQAVSHIQDSALHIDRDIGFLSWELRPTELENLGLVDALSSFVREWSSQYAIAAEFHSNFESNGNGRLNQSVETNLYRIVQEALNNVLKHAQARSVSVLLQHRGHQIVLIVEDDGRGIDDKTESANGNSPGGLGLIGMRERAALLKGDLEIDSGEGSGTSVMVRIPMH